MIIDFNHKTLTGEEYFIKRNDSVIDIAKWITPIMNDIHRLNHGYTFWLSILNEHLKSCINRKYYFEQNIHKNVPRYFADINAYGLPERKAVFIKTLNYFLKQFKFGANGKYIDKAIRANDEFCLGHRAKELEKDGRGVALKDYYPFNWLPDLKAQFRWRHNIDGVEDEFLKKILQHLPYVYVEFFRSNYPKIDLRDAKSKSFHCEHLDSLYMRILLALFFEKGSEVHLYQGGCSEGETKYQPGSFLYETLTKFHTYGWKRNVKDVPDRAFRIETYSNSYSQNRDKVNIEYDFLLVLSLSNPENRKHYKKFTEYFINNLDFDKYQRILVRPRPRSRYLDNKEEVKYIDLNSNVEIDNGKAEMVLSSAKVRANVLVFTPATNLYENALSQHPFFAYDMFPPASDVFKKHLDFFKDVGILHDSVESMVNYINSIDIENWWQNILQDARFSLFLEEFCGRNSA